MKHLLALCALLTLPLAAQSGLTVESWTNLPQSDSIVVLQEKGISVTTPNTTTTVANAQVSGLSVAKTGQRLRGSITPTVTDTYTFWISGEDNVALWISDDTSRFNKKLVAYHLGTSTVGQWDKHPNQKSIPIQLTAGQSYYLEAQVMDINGGGHVEIAWRGQKGRYTLKANGVTATQSSTQWGKDPSRLIDGNTSGVWGKDEVSLTQSLPNSWVAIDFGQDRDVNQVVLYNRSDSQNFLSNFRISVLDANDAELMGENFYTTSGNVGNSMTWNLPSTVTGARKVKVQLLGLNRAGNWYLSLAEIEAYGVGLVPGQVDFRETIPGTYLTTLQADPNDTNDNNLSDTWETQTGLSASTLPGALLEYGDPDKDGISNFQEQWLGSNPLIKEALANGLTRYMWMGINGSVMTNFTLNSKFYSYPNDIQHVPGVDAKLMTYTLFGARYRGAIVAPVTGEYRFWISGNGGGAELWLADGSITDKATNTPLTNRFGKKLLCTSGLAAPQNEYDYSPSQRSAVIHLVEGQEYYLEVLHAVQNSTNNHVSVAWQAPGGQRQVIPETTFLSNDPLSAADADDDNLPDTWETAKTLDPTKNGFNDLNQSEYGDPDADKLTNLQEYQNGTDPKDSDTDNDGYSDSDEVRLYGSDPTVSNNLAPVALTLPALNQYTAATGGWSTQSNGTLLATERRGGITYTFTVTQPGVHEVAAVVGLLQPNYWYTQYIKLSLTLDNDSSPFASDVLTYQNSPKTMRAVTPWLAAGTHSITLYHDNYDASLRLRLDSLTIKRLGGADLDENNIPDWLETKAVAKNALTRVPSESRTSPVSIEGISQQITATTLGVLAPGATEATNVPVTTSINNSFFADVPLSATGAVTLNASFASGLVTETHNITWTATNLFETFTEATLHIRKGDALLLDAWSGVSADGQPFTVTSNGTLLADPTNQNTTHTSGVPIAATFNTAGTYTLVATHNGQTATVTLKVHEANFGASHVVQINTARTWTPPTLGVSHIVESDERIVFTETTTTGARKFHVKADKPITRYVVARLPENVEGAPSAILSRGTVQAYDLARTGQTNDAQVIHRYDDGTWLMHATFVAVNLPDGVTIRVTLNNQGTLFTNGSNIIELTSEDFDANGIANLYFEYNGTTPPKICHTTQVLFQP